MKKATPFIRAEQVETQVFDWGRLQWLSEPGTTGSQVMTTGLVSLEPGKGHERHNHPGCEEVLFVLEGYGEQTVETPQGVMRSNVRAGDLIYIASGAFHSTINAGIDLMKLLAVYQYAGPEAELRAAADSILPPLEPCAS